MLSRLIRTCAAGAVCLTALAGHAPLARAQAPPGTPAPNAVASPALVEPLAVPAVTPAPAVPTATPPAGRRLSALGLSAKRIAFYSNRFIIGADGAVDVALGDGTHVTGDTFAMDLRLNRFVVAGNVTVRTGTAAVSGAAFAEYLDFDRAYFVPVTTEPDRWTFAAGDYAHPLLGREMPGDTFFLPDLAGERVFLTAKHATIDPKQSVRFTPATINFGLTSLPFPSYFLTFSPNPNFSQNALPGAYVDGPLDFAGGAHALSSLHLRYDPLNHVFPAFEQHQVSANSYFVFSANPLTRPLKQYNFLGFDRLSPGVQVQLALQETAFQHAFSRPLSATAYATLQVTASLPHSYLQFTTQNYYDSLLARPATFADSTIFGRVYFYGDPTHNWIGDHPSQQQLAWVGFRHPVGKLPFTFQLRSSIGAAKNTTTPLQTFGGVAYTSLFNKAVGLNVASKSIVVAADGAHRGRDLYATASFDKQRQFFSLPHFVDSQSESLALTKIVDPRRLTLVASYTIGNLGDFYGASQPLAYASSTAFNPYTGQSFPEYRAFRGFATTHSLVQQMVYTPTDLLTLNVTMRENRDFPRAVPGPPQTVGDAVTFLNYGVTPYQADIDLRYRINRQLTLDLGRSYFFNFGGYERWSPRFSFALTK
ncbi:MAG: hypothetical protein NVSMB19_02460 [Vulcanimicrobiaceae bacterium]